MGATPNRTSLPGRSSLGTPPPALFQLARAHAHETVIWTNRGKGARHTFDYDLVFDPFSGSGTTTVAPTKELDRSFVGAKM